MRVGRSSPFCSLPGTLAKGRIAVMPELVFLKLGGSLITNKSRPYTPRLDRLRELADEIQSVVSGSPDLRLLLGHGSGSFGHFAVQEVLTPLESRPSTAGRPAGDRAYWQGFSEVSYRASELNRRVMDAMHDAGLPSVSLAPSAMLTASDGQIVAWDLASLEAALNAGVVPVIFGDIVFDAVQGGRVLSTESLMIHLARRLRPRRILLAGLEEGVWADFPKRQTLIQKISPANYNSLSAKIGGSQGTDVTGGMRMKVEEMLAVVNDVEGLTVQIFSGEKRGNLAKALAEAALGTMISV
jgi:isopentenyl phosphate kinase